jgi:predicted ATPase
VEAERCYQQAINIARELHASMLELRAALRLSRLWREQGKTQEARDVLSTAYAKMTEGFSLPDLIQAQTLLNELT